MTPQRQIGVLDHQNVHISHISSPWHDLSCFIAGALELVGRRSHERDLLHTYLGTPKKAGGPLLSIDETWDDYRRHQLHGFL